MYMCCGKWYTSHSDLTEWNSFNDSRNRLGVWMQIYMYIYIIIIEHTLLSIVIHQA